MLTYLELTFCFKGVLIVEIPLTTCISPVYIQHICDCAVYYVGKVYTRVTDADIYKDGKFRASEKVHVPTDCMHDTCFP